MLGGLINMDAIIDFGTLATVLKGSKPNYKDCFQNIHKLHPIVFSILTRYSTKTPDIPTKKNKINSSTANQVILSILKNRNTKIAYIAVKKIKKCLTFDYCCVRNRLLRK